MEVVGILFSIAVLAALFGGFASFVGCVLDAAAWIRRGVVVLLNRQPKPEAAPSTRAEARRAAAL